MPDFGIMRGFNEKLFGDKLVAGQLPTQLGLIGSQQVGDYLLDAYPNSSAAYALRLLRKSYTGSAIRVRRSSNNAESDIGFTSVGDLDISALTTFCSGTDGFVTTWYDQSGNAANATQTFAANQPKIVASGSVILDGGKPTIQQSGTQRLAVNNVNYTDGFFVVKVNTQTVVNYFIDGNGQYFANGSFSGVDGFGGAYSGGVRSLTGEDLNRHLAYYNLSGGNLNISKDGAGLINVGVFQQNNTCVGILGRGFGNLDLLGNGQEIIFYNSNQSSNRTAIETNINSYYGIY
jgi:hypothetical protein